MKNSIKLSFAILWVALLGCAEEIPQPAADDMIRNTWKPKEVKTGVGAGDLSLIYSSTTAGNWVDYSLYRIAFNEDGSYHLTNKEGIESSGNWGFAAGSTQILFDEGTADEVRALILDISPTETILQYEEPNDKFGMIVTEFTLIPAFN